jgi:hypothetical protein
MELHFKVRNRYFVLLTQFWFNGTDILSSLLRLCYSLCYFSKEHLKVPDCNFRSVHTCGFCCHGIITLVWHVEACIVNLNLVFFKLRL